MACGDSGGAKCVGTRTASAIGVMVLSESFFQPLVAGDQKASLAILSPTLPVQALRRLPCLGSFSVVPRIRHIEGAPLAGVLLCRSVHQALKGAPWVGSYSVVQCQGFDGSASLLVSCQCCRVGDERLW